MAGFIQIPRDITEKWVYKNPRRFWMWTQLLFLAPYEDGTTRIGNQKVPYKKGQIVRTISNLMNVLQITNKALHNYFDVLVEEGMITVVSTPKYSVVTILSLTDNVPEIGGKSGPKVQPPHRKAKPVKEYREEEEEKNKENISSTTPPPRSREDEEKFFEEIRKADAFWEQSAMSLRTDVPTLKAIAERFFNEMLAKEKLHPSLQECKNHLLNWARIALKKEGAGGGAKKINKNTNATTQSKYEARRASDIQLGEEGTDDSTF